MFLILPFLLLPSSSSSYKIANIKYVLNVIKNIVLVYLRPYEMKSSIHNVSSNEVSIDYNQPMNNATIRYVLFDIFSHKNYMKCNENKQFSCSGVTKIKTFSHQIDPTHFNHSKIESTEISHFINPVKKNFTDNETGNHFLLISFIILR